MIPLGIAEAENGRRTDNRPSGGRLPAAPMGAVERPGSPRLKVMQLCDGAWPDAEKSPGPESMQFAMKVRAARITRRMGDHAAGGRPRLGRGPACFGIRPASESARRSNIST
jgi:hypothetical protein